MNEGIKNVPASVKAKLQKISKKTNLSFDLLLLMFLQERFLYRLSISKYREHFILKGGLLLFAFNSFKGRSTKDVDFLGLSINNDPTTLKNAVIEICNISCNDGIIFKIESIATERIKEDADYEGIRIKIETFLDKTRKVIQIDIGFGDVIYPHPIIMNYPVLIESDSLILNTYTKESIIAEKFEAMIKLSDANSRMKDFYDIFIFLKTDKFKGKDLKLAIEETFNHRKTIINNYIHVLSETFFENPDKGKLWNAFLIRIGVPIIDYRIVGNSISNFLKPISESIINNSNFNYSWNNEKEKWE
jgi:hypothetical protein